MAEAAKNPKKRNVLSEETTKRKLESNKLNAQTVINTGPAFNRWRELKDEEGCLPDADFALIVGLTVEPHHLKDHDYCQMPRVSARLSQRKPRALSRCPCCDSGVDSEHHHPAPAEQPPRKRRRTSAVHRSTSQRPAKRARSPLADKLKNAIALEDLPEASTLVPSPRPEPSTSDLPDDGPVQIHRLSVDTYRQLYSSVVDDPHQRPYSQARGLRLKQQLWERLDRPTFTETYDEEGRLQVNVTYGAGAHPPRFDVDVSGEPKPRNPPRKRVKN